MAKASGGAHRAGGRRGRTSAQRAAPGQLRIIGGRLRGRRLAVPHHPGLRPTTDRVRETLFNWLVADIPGSRCLDCFAGSGALGFEAFSRGAAEVILIERAARVAAGLASNAETLRAAAVADPQLPDGRLEVIQADVLRWLATRPPISFDVVFLDPPFADVVLAEACRQLTRGWLAPGAAIYLETPASAPMPALPEHWHVDRQRTAGQVRYALARVSPQSQSQARLWQPGSHAGAGTRGAGASALWRGRVCYPVPSIQTGKGCRRPPIAGPLTRRPPDPPAQLVFAEPAHS